MREAPALGLSGWIGLAVVLALAVGTRVGYLLTCCQGGAAAAPLIVQGQGPRLEFEAKTQLGSHDASGPTEFDNLVDNLRTNRWFGSLAPLSDKEEQTAHVGPGYYWLALLMPSDTILRQVQTGLSVLTVVCLFFFARTAFASNIVAIAVGTIAALHPFWIVNVAELADGTLVTFLLSAALMLGVHAARTGGPLSSALFGLSLAALALDRPSLLPFSFLSLGWFLLRCRSLRLGWFAGLLAVLGFGNGLAPWLVRNQSVFHEATPIADSAYVDLWSGVCPKATGGPIDEAMLRESLPAARLQELLSESNQPRRYAMLSHDFFYQVRQDPARFLRLRFAAAGRFLMGHAFVADGTLVQARGGNDGLPQAVRNWAPVLHIAVLLLLFSLAIFGWRLSERWSADSRLATFALIWIPLPVIMTHAEMLSGPRLPWDVPLIVFAGFAAAWLVPSVRREALLVPQIKKAIQEAETRQM